MNHFLITIFASLILFAVPITHSEAQESFAPANDLYAVDQVEVDVTAESAASARDQAIAAGQRQALEKLLTRMGADYNASALTDSQIAWLVQDIEIQQERLSSVRYLGTFNVRFKPDAVKEILSGAGAKFSEIKSKSLLVLPVMIEGNRAVLWEEPTDWRAAWERAESTDGPVPLIVPEGELDDISTISAAEAMQAKPEVIAKAAEHYDAGGVLVAVLSMPENGETKQLTITVNRYDAEGQSASPLGLTASSPDQAIASIRGQLQQGWQQATQTVTTGPVIRLPARVPIQSLQDWAEVRARLQRTAVVDKIDVVTLSRDSAHIEIVFRGETGQLRTALAQHGLSLDQAKYGGAWELRSR